MNRPLAPAWRRLVLGAALAAGLVAWVVQHATVVRAAEPDVVVIAQSGTKSDAPRTGDAKPAEAAPSKAPAPKATGAGTPSSKSDADKDAADNAASDAEAEAEAAADAAAPKGTDITIDRHGIRVDKGNKHVTVQAFGADREYDSFESFVQDAPWLAGLVFLVVLLVFLVPLLIIVLLIWYKVRKNRMLNETMLKLAEKGVVPPAEAMASLDANRAPLGPSTAPLYEQAKQIRQRTVASDLRKGVILAAIGLGLTFFSMLDDGSPNSVGLILLFLGIGYFVLWYLEDRASAPRTGGTPPPGGA
jgi:hypothetical protein